MNQSQLKWYEENKPTGIAFGYPECCIKEFGMQPPELLRRTQPTKDDQRRYKAGCIDGIFTGFIPCIEHAKQIVQGKITLGSLIENRDINLPVFPLA